MIKNISKINTLNSKFYFNILLHITILFLILSILFTTYISKITTKTMNNEIKHIIKPYIDNVQNEIKKNTYLYNDFIAKFDNSEDINYKIEIENKIKELKNTINSQYDYYFKLFSKENTIKKSVNNEIFFYIKFINILLIVTMLSFLFYLIKSKSITNEEILNVFIENILTFLFVGIIEFLFFRNIIMKYVPIEPSLLIKSFLYSFQKNNISTEP